MLRRAVDSTTMRSVGYQAQDRVLEIEFDSGAVYQYLGVPARIYEQLLRAESKGRYFNSEIRESYPYIQVNRARAAGS
ncbi:MAG: KTSC domain-containing protein [Acidobacteriaceae bacterium]|nr:KTSC domain-containing protein [Acidobacteriaceae bacterium]MBV9294309.1 KTSC domain-containing protein [Acidobacteriaceae bacterium]MBV9763737.1 KTSC domain-containing protein [Acidobacteriaceae bacterium]